MKKDITKNATSINNTTSALKSNHHSLYKGVLEIIKSEGLLKKNPGYYIKLLIIVSFIMVSVWLGLFLVSQQVNNTLVSYTISVLFVMIMGVLTAQYGFVAHESAHKQVFNNNKLNEWFGLVLANLFAGMSYGFWLNKHNRHHQKPNHIGSDPDIELPILSFYEESFNSKSGLEKFASKHQGKLFPFLLSFTGYHFIFDSTMSLIKKRRYVKHRFIEAFLFLIRQVFPIVMLISMFSWLQGVILYLIFQATFGIFIGGAFAPNHKGMPVVPHDVKMDFFNRQVLLSRNISPSPIKDLLMGGLNYQVEHHLFPSMPRTNLKKANIIIKQYCIDNNTPLTEVGLFESYKIVIKYLNDVGLNKGNIDPFVCPIVAQFRPVK